jgi:gamma-glutamyl phosphate reductase
MTEDSKTDRTDINKLADEFVAHPEKFVLYRGEEKINHGGLHPTTDKDWVKNFGDKIISGHLPAEAKIKVIYLDDLDSAHQRGIMTDNAFYESIFKEGYDAIIGHDTTDLRVLDVVVNPKHLHLFKPV